MQLNENKTHDTAAMMMVSMVVFIAAAFASIEQTP